MHKPYLQALAVSTLGLFIVHGTDAAEYHVSVKTGSTEGDGSSLKPFKTISAAAEIAQAGDTITVHTGVYREAINPPRGGESDERRIVYQAAEGAKVVIKGSEPAKGWVPTENDAWKLTLPDSFFGDFNPYKSLIGGDWFRPQGRTHSRGAVYLDGHWLNEASELSEVLQPQGATPLWWGQDSSTDDAATTTIYAQFKGVDPNEADVEINARETIFYPRKPGRNFITVRRFIMMHAAPDWAPPTAEQVGLIGTHWSKGWIIEDNVIAYSRCVGLTLGKYGDEWDNDSATAGAYNKTIQRALENGWNRAHVGSHLVRNNHIHNCEQAGIVGSMGGAFSEVSNNVIHDINTVGLFKGAEIAGIKFHGPIDTVVKNNHVYRSRRYGIWLDWMSQGVRVTGNLAHSNGEEDLFMEVNHGPHMVDNNIFLSTEVLKDESQGGAYAHNFFQGKFLVRPQTRRTPYHKTHSTEIAGLLEIPCGDNRFMNNLLENPLELDKYESLEDMIIEDNAAVSDVVLTEKADGFYLEFTLSGEARGEMVSTERLGRTRVTGDAFVNPDGSPIRVDTDYFGQQRNPKHPASGPFAKLVQGHNSIKVWPRK